MFGISLSELLLIGAVALMVVGPSRLPAMLGTLGRWSYKLRRTLFEVRHQSGIDEILRSEGITGGLSELRELREFVRGDLRGVSRNLAQRAIARPPPPDNNSSAAVSAPEAASGASSPSAASTSSVAKPETVPHQEDPYAGVPYDRSREYPDEGADAYGALPDDLWELGAASGTAPVKSAASMPAPPRPAPLQDTGSETQREGAEAATSSGSTTIDAHGHER